MERKNFGYMTTKIYGGKKDDKIVGIHFKAGNKQALKMSRAILQVIEYGKAITVFRYNSLKDSIVRIPIMSHK